MSFADYIQYVKTAARAAERIGEMQAKTLHYRGDTYVLDPLNGKIEQIEELHQLAEHLKKILPEKVVQVETKPRFPQVQKEVEKELKARGVPEETVKIEASKLLGILQGLKFSNYSSGVVENAVRGLEGEIEKLLEERNLELLGLYFTTLHLLKNGEFKRLEEFLREVY